MCRRSTPNSMSTKTVKVKDNFSETRSHSELDTYNSYIFHTSSCPISQKPILVNTTLEGVPVQMELDTGAARSLISKKDFFRLWPSVTARPLVYSSSAFLTAYGGTSLKVHGEVKVKVGIPSSEVEKEATIIIIDGDGPCLLGRDLISEFGISNLSILYASSTDYSNILNLFPSLFAPGLGCYKDATFSLQVDPTVPPKYCKSRPVPYALRAKVDAELERLVAEGIISPVAHSDWAAAVVPVLKANGTIRICGD